MPYTWQAEDSIEPISSSTIEAIANIGTYSVATGCTVSYGVGTMVCTIASGNVVFNSVLQTVVGNNVTLVADASNPRWTWIAINSSGVAVMVAGTAAANPSVPELGNNVGIALVRVEAAQTSANAIVYKLDKRVLSPASQAVTTTTGDIVYASAAFTPARLGIGSTGQLLTVSGGLPAWVGQVTSIGAILDGGGAPIPANTIIYVRVPFACTINEFTILADQSGSITVKVYKDTYANYPPNASDDISNGGLAVTTATKATDTTLTGWTTAIAAGDVLAFTNTTIATSILRATCQLKVTRA